MNRLALLFIITNLNCVEFNNCAPTSGPLIGELALTMDVRKSTVRSKSSPVGNWITDAMFWRAQHACKSDRARPCPDLAWINSGAIRAETVCGSRQFLLKGPLHLADIEELLPYSSDLVLVELNGRDILFALEQAISGVDDARFLQVSGISFRIEDKKVRDLKLTSRESDELIELDKRYQVVMSSYLAHGNDGFTAFFLRDAHNAVMLNSQNRPMMKFDPESGTIANAAGQAVSYRGALLEWISQQTAENRPIGADLEPRIRH